MTDIPLIGIAGKARSGKDTAATYIVQTYGFTRQAFADPMKNMMRVIGLSEAQLNGGLKETADDLFGCSPRYMMQTLGTEWGRDCISEDFWLHVAERLRPKSAVVFTDVRFDNEAEWVRERGVLIHISRGNRPHMDNAGHASESGVRPQTGDFFISNDGTIEELYAEIDKICRQLGLGTAH